MKATLELVISTISIALIFLLIAFVLSNEHSVLKLLFIFLSIITCLQINGIAYVHSYYGANASSNSSALNDLSNLILTNNWIIYVALFVSIFYFVIYYFIQRGFGK